VAEITRLCGYLPLAIVITGRQLAHHPAWTPAGLADDLAAARDRLELIAAENVSVAAAFGLSYRDLTAAQRRLFRRLGLHPGPDIDAYAAAALDDTSLGRRAPAPGSWVPCSGGPGITRRPPRRYARRWCCSATSAIPSTRPRF
jgi:hypothetical protein